MASIETIKAAADYYQGQKKCSELFPDIFMAAAHFMETNRLLEPKYKLNQILKDKNFVKEIYTNPDGVLMLTNDYKEVQIIYHH